MKEGYGSHLTLNPEKIHDIVRQARNRVNNPISVKTRIYLDPKRTVDMARQVEACGAAFLSGMLFQVFVCVVYYMCFIFMFYVLFVICYVLCI